MEVIRREAQMSDQSNATCWPPSVQIVGEEISRFHCIYFPAILLAAGYELPESVFVHGHWTVNGEKWESRKSIWSLSQKWPKLLTSNMMA